MKNPFLRPITPDYESFLKCIKRQGTPERVHHIELFLDGPIKDEIASKFGVYDGISNDDKFRGAKKNIALQRFLGYDYVLASIWGYNFKFNWNSVDDVAGLKKENGQRNFMDMHKGPITTWEEFEKYPWPDYSRVDTSEIEWLNKNLPDDMCMIGGLTAHFAEDISFFMGYEELCIAFYENRELVRAIMDKSIAMHEAYVKTLLQFDRVKIIWGSDDMGFKTGPMFSPSDFREFIFPAHKKIVEMVHGAGKIYFLHACGKLDLLMDDLINDVGIDAKHSFEDTIENVADAKERYGSKIALLGGVDVDYLCRSDEKQIRQRVRDILGRCYVGGGYCLGSGNSIANYVPVDNYLSMVDEGRRFA